MRQRGMALAASAGDNSNTKSMEDVWDDIKLPSLHDSANSTTTTHSAFRNLVLHEFLSGPLISGRDTHTPATLEHEPEPEPEPPLFNLSSSSELHARARTTPHYSSSSFRVLDDSPPVCPSLSNKSTRKRLHYSSDRHHQRMIKNRESAARSRARKQAYTHDLEQELACLREENARLRQQLEKFPLRPLDQHLKRRTLLRTSTAPF